MNIIFILLISYCFANPEEECAKATNCQSCMERSPLCGWCFNHLYEDKNFGPGHRCGTIKTLQDRGCPKNSIEFTRSSLSSTRLRRQTSDDEIQLRPISQSASIRPGKPLDIKLTFEAIGDYPVDLYYLTDLSYSMMDDLVTVSLMTKKISEELGKLTKRLRMGFGGFVDKPVFPFINPNTNALQNPCINLDDKPKKCDPPFLYKHILSMTSNFTDFQVKTNQTTPSGNLDTLEGGLDALLQVAYCQEDIKWDNDARKIVLFTSDGGFHVAGDGRLAGLIKPPPRQCQLNFQADRFNSSLKYLGWHNSIETDYPSVGEISHVLNEKGINVIFATNPENKLLYDGLAEFLPSAAVGVIHNDSKNIVELLKENYQKILKKVTISPKYDENLVDVQVLTKCHDETTFEAKLHCLANPVGGKIEYTIKVDTKKCFTGETPVILQIGGLKDNATILVKSACNCEKCSTTSPIEKSDRCNNKGKFFCGSCVCDSESTGDFCECSTTSKQTDAEMKKMCTKENDNEVCSGRGRCKCGSCHCSLPRYVGAYCECDKLGCKRATDDNEVCGGSLRGECLCNGTCKCKEGYRGERCDCLTSNKKCQDPNNATAPVCSNHGNCDCGYCFCETGFTGEQCQNVKGDTSQRCSSDKDKVLTNCMLCLYESLVVDDKPKFPLEGEIVQLLNHTNICSEKCNASNVDYTKIKLMKQYNTEDGSEICVIYNKKGCRIYVTYKSSEKIYADRKGRHICPCKCSKMHKVGLKRGKLGHLIIYTLVAVRRVFTTNRHTRKLLMNFQIRKECPDTASMILIIVGVIIGIVIVGIILLLIWKVVVTIDDRRENAIYQEQLKNAKWETEENPIFKPPVTTVKNPLYQGGDD